MVNLIGELRKSEIIDTDYGFTDGFVIFIPNGIDEGFKVLALEKEDISNFDSITLNMRNETVIVKEDTNCYLKINGIVFESMAIANALAAQEDPYYTYTPGGHTSYRFT